MEDLRNKTIKMYKIMWAGEETFLWDMRDELPIHEDNKVYEILNKYFDFINWKKLFSDSYKEWLIGDNSNIYNLNFILNKQVINILPKINKTLEKNNLQIYFWYDVDRDVFENYKWEYCPITNKKLIRLKDMHSNNSLISEDIYLVFPSSI